MDWSVELLGIRGKGAMHPKQPCSLVVQHSIESVSLSLKFYFREKTTYFTRATILVHKENFRKVVE